MSLNTGAYSSQRYVYLRAALYIISLRYNGVRLVDQVLLRLVILILSLAAFWAIVVLSKIAS